jgi:uroporphyrinogen-III synthase
MNVLITAAEEDRERITHLISPNSNYNVLFKPLEQYKARLDGDPKTELPEWDNTKNIVHGNVRNVRFFIKWMHRHGLDEEVRQRVNFTTDALVAGILEQEQVPAIYPEGEKPIDLLELMLRLQRTDPVLYPTGAGLADEMPGLLQELDIPVLELDLYSLEGPEQESLEQWRKQLEEEQPQVVIFHSRRSVVRTLTAFPGLDFNETTLLAADAGVRRKLEDNDLSAELEGEGSWESIFEQLQQVIR